MKTILSLFIAVLFSLTTLHAQETGKKASKTTEEKNLKAVVKMQNGKVIETRDGKEIPVTTQININGTQVNADGALTFKDGHKEILKEGDVILENGLVLRDAGQTFTDPGMNK